VIKTADWIIDVGPEAWPGLDPGARDGGGEIIAAGMPKEIVREKRSYTGAFLKPVAARGRGIASRLVQGVLEEARARGLKVVPRRLFVSTYIARHLEYRDLVA
jgi:predicted N-acetyltransferase YhbS